MKRISFAQNREDILLDRSFGGRTGGFYIDVGACHPVFHSVTKFFYDRGWRGVNIEPIPSTFGILAENRPRDVNLHAGLSDREETLLFHEAPAAIGYSTFSSEQAEQLRRWGYELVEHCIPVTTLARVCEQYAPETIDFLKIDVESHEREVLEGADWVRFRPRVILIEATRPGTTIPCHEDWESLLLENGYLFASFDGLNRYYVRAEDRDLLPLLSVPVNATDDYETFEHVDRLRDFEARLENAGRSLQEALASYEGVRAELADTSRALAETRGELDATRAALAETGATLEQTCNDLERTRDELAAANAELAAANAELAAARARLELFEGWGPTTVSVVRRLRRIGLRLPLAKAAIRRAIALRREIRADWTAEPMAR